MNHGYCHVSCTLFKTKKFFLVIDLTDEDIFIIAESISYLGSLRRLSNALRLEGHVAERAITNNRDIRAASYQVLQEWQRKQYHSQEAYENMMEALLNCGMKQIAYELRMKHQGELVLGNFTSPFINLRLVFQNKGICVILLNFTLT